jgi:hypothetical protein
MRRELLGRVVVLLCAGTALEGCAGARPEPAPRVERVEIPVPVRCSVSLSDRPALPTDSLSPDADVWAMMQALRAERLTLRAWASGLDVAVRACLEASPPAAPGRGGETGSPASPETRSTPLARANRPP